MIGRLSGVLLSLDDNVALVDVNGVGYEVQIPRRLIDRVQIGDELVLHTHLSVVNDVQHLFGFETSSDRTVFRKLLGVSRFGPKSAAALLSELSGPEIARAIEVNDSRTLTNAPGVGRKVAESIVFTLRDSVSKWGLGGIDGEGKDRENFPSSSVTVQATMALRQLGFQRMEAEDAVSQVFEEGLEVGELIQRALRVISVNV